MDNSSSAFAVIGLVFILLYLGILIVSIVIGILSIIAKWKLYEKAGEPGWSSIIPVYNYVKMIKIALGDYKLAWIYIGITVGYVVFASVANLLPLFSENQSELSVLSMVFMLLAFLFIIPMYIIAGYVSYMFGKAYGKSTAWNVCMIFFGGIMIIIMGFDKKTTYIGPKGIPQGYNYY